MKVRRAAPAPYGPILSYFKSTGRLFIAEAHDRLWVTDSYLMTVIDGAEGAHPVARMLADYNLPLEPMVCEVGRTIVRTTKEPPKVESLIPPSTDGLLDASAMTLCGAEIQIEQGGALVNIFARSDGQRFALDLRRRAVVERLCGMGRWMHGGEAPRPAKYVTDNGVVGLLMPVRTLSNLADEEPKASAA